MNTVFFFSETRITPLMLKKSTNVVVKYFYPLQLNHIVLCFFFSHTIFKKFKNVFCKRRLIIFLFFTNAKKYIYIYFVRQPIYLINYKRIFVSLFIVLGDYINVDDTSIRNYGPICEIMGMMSYIFCI